MSVLRRETYSNNTKEIQMLIRLAVALALVLIPQAVFGQVVAYDMVGSTSQNLISYTNPSTDAFASGGVGDAADARPRRHQRSTPKMLRGSRSVI